MSEARFDWGKQTKALEAIADCWGELLRAVETSEETQLLLKAERGARRHERDHRGVYGPDMEARRVWRCQVTPCARELVLRWVRKYDPSEPVSAGDWEKAPPGRLEACSLAERLQAAGRRPALERCAWVEYGDLAGRATDRGGVISSEQYEQRMRLARGGR